MADTKSAPLSARILKEIKTGLASKNYDFFFDAEGKYGDKNAAYLRFTVTSGPYTGQTHVLQIKFSYGSNVAYTFPQHPPNVLFMTPIYHVNVSTSGSICVDVLKTEAWSPLNNIDTIFSSIILLMLEPNPSSPFNGEAAKDYRESMIGGGKDKKILDEARYGSICLEKYKKGLKGNDHINKLLKAEEFKKSEEVPAEKK